MALTLRFSQQLGISLPHRIEDRSSQLDQFVSSNLRHHEASDAELESSPDVSDWVRQTFAAMKLLVSDPNDGIALDRLDQIRAQFKAAANTFDFAPPEPAIQDLRAKAALLEQSLAAQRKAEAELDETRRRLDTATGDLAQAERIINYIATRYAERKNRNWRREYRRLVRYILQYCNNTIKPQS